MCIHRPRQALYSFRDNTPDLQIRIILARNRARDGEKKLFQAWDSAD